jgi:hypothetical protein
MRCIAVFVVIIAILSVASYATPSEWVAYNDSVYEQGVQFIADNVTTFGLGRGNPFPESGELIKLSDGRDTDVTVTYLEHTSVGNTINWATDAAQFDKGSDAGQIFNDIVDASGNMSYNDGPGWHLDLVIEGLDPDGFYTFAGSVNRNGAADYADRVTNWKIIGADGFTYASSDEAHKIAEDMVEFVTGVNNEGCVAKWMNIAPGSDREIIIRTSHGVGDENGGIAGAHEYKGYAGGVFMLEFQGMQAVEAHGKMAATWSKIKSARTSLLLQGD